MNALRNPFVWVGLTALLVLLIIVTLQLSATPPPPVTAPPEVHVATLDPSDAGQPTTRATARPRPQPARATPGRDAGMARAPEALAVESWGRKKYREQAQEDAEALGDRYADMQRLWKLGRYGGGSKGAIEALERLIDEYGDTHRADCARYLLTRQRLLKGRGQADARREAAVTALSGLIDDQNDSRCETGARASSLSQLLLATQVYRYTDFDRSVDMLKDLAAAEPDEVDNVGVSLALRARAILKEVEQSPP